MLWLIPMALWMDSVWLVIGRHYENIVVSRIWYNLRIPFDLVALNSFEVFLSSRFTIHSFIHSLGCFRLISKCKIDHLNPKISLNTNIHISVGELCLLLLQNSNFNGSIFLNLRESNYSLINIRSTIKLENWWNEEFED